MKGAWNKGDKQNARGEWVKDDEERTEEGHTGLLNLSSMQTAAEIRVPFRLGRCGTLWSIDRSIDPMDFTLNFSTSKTPRGL
jgi:hypothetical protein